VNTEWKTTRPPAHPERGFTRVELMAVIVTAVFLGALVLPLLAKGNTGSREAVCLNHHRLLVRACILYSQDFNDRLPNNYTIPATDGAITSGAFDNWANNVMTWGASGSVEDLSNTNVNWAQKGLLSSYLHTNSSVFKCPSDIYLSAAQRSKGWHARLRSVSMNGFVGAASSSPTDQTNLHAWVDPSYRQFLKLTQIPQPTSTFVTLDEHPDSINEGFFIVSISGTQWGDLPASYHDGACGFSFADGHSEMHKWLSATSRYPVKFSYSTRPFDAAGRMDFQWYKDRLQLILFR
jgi:prepilin-type processing-associated H-X9-DG protein